MSAAPARTRRLRVGEIVRHDGRLWRVDLVNHCRARLVPVGGRAAKFKTWIGQNVEFDAPGRPISISPDSEIERVDASTLTEERTMAAKKTEKKSRAAKAKTEDLCVFALRMAPAERDAFHKMAGPGKAASVSRAILVAAAKRDTAAIQKILEG